MHVELRVSFNNSFYRLAEQLHISSLRETYCRWNIVHRRSRLFHTIHIDTHLCIGQRNVTHVGMLNLSSFLLYDTSTHQNFQYLILNTLHTTRLSQSLRIQHYAKALIYLYCQLDRHNRRQAHIPQYRSNSKVLGIDNLCNDAMNFLFQDIHRHIALHLCLHSLLLRLWQCLFVHLLILVQRNSLYLHRYGRHHVWWLLVEDEVV